MLLSSLATVDRGSSVDRRGVSGPRRHRGMTEQRWAPPIRPRASPAIRRCGCGSCSPRQACGRAPGFVEQADGNVVDVQLVHMGFVHHVWLPIDRIKKRSLRPQGRR
jgi:hypothetical protein